MVTIVPESSYAASPSSLTLAGMRTDIRRNVSATSTA